MSNIINTNYTAGIYSNSVNKQAKSSQTETTSFANKVAEKRESAVDQLVHDSADIAVAVEDVDGIVTAVFLIIDHLIGGHAEDKGILLSHFLHNLHIGAIHGADGQRAV